MRGLLAWMGPMLRQRGRALLLSLLLALLTAGAAIGLLGVSGWFLAATALVTGALATFNLFVPSALVRGLAFTRILARYGERLVGHQGTLWLLADLRQRLFGAMLRLTPGQLRRWRDGDLVARLTADIDTLDSVFLQTLQPLLVGALAGTALVAVLAWQLSWAALVVGACVLLALLLLPAWIARRVQATGRERQQHAADLRQQVLQAVEGHADLLALQAAGRAETEWARSCARLRTLSLQDARLLASAQALLLLSSGLAMLAVAIVGAGAVQAGTLGGALLVGLVLAVAGLFEVIAPVLRGAVRLGAASAAVERLQAIEQTAPAIVESDDPQPIAATASLHVQNLRFRHHPQFPLLEGIDLHIGPGERVVLTGASGSGKSTLLALLLRLHDPQAGQICWDAVPLPALSLAALHRQVALLSQDSVVFLGTLRDNLLIGCPGGADDRLWQVLDQVGLAQEVQAMPDGLDQWLGEGGRTLSAGQARRLCLARVLLSEARLLILDEPTEGLDPEAEQRLLARLPALLDGRSLLLVTHTRVPAGIADQHWRLADGRLQRLG